MTREDSRRSLRVFLSGQTFSIVGDTMLWLAMGVWVKELTGSNAAAGLVFFFFAVPAVLAPIYGWIADRYARRIVLLVGNICGAVVVLPLLAVRGPEGLPLLYVVMTGYGVVSGVLGAAQSAMLVDMADRSGLSKANSYLRTVREGTKFLGPLLGAGLFAVAGPHVVVIVDSVSFGVAAITILFIQVSPNPSPGEISAAEALLAGFKHLWAERDLRNMTLILAAAMAAIGLIEAALFGVTEGLGRPAPFQGVIMAAQGLGSIIAGPWTPILSRRLGEARLVALSLALFGSAVLLLLVPLDAVALAGSMLIGGAVVWLLIGSVTLVQLRSPKNLQGRAYASYDLALTLPQTASIGFGALLIAYLDYRAILGFVAICLVVCAGVALKMGTSPDRDGGLQGRGRVARCRPSVIETLSLRGDGLSPANVEVDGHESEDDEQ